jgi:PAS domain S-box-containing protein
MAPNAQCQPIRLADVQSRSASRYPQVRQQAPEAGRESEELFRRVAGSSTDLVRTSGPDKLCAFFNPSWMAFTGRTVDEELGKGWTSRIHPEDVNRCLENSTVEFDARSEFSLEYRLRRHDGDYRWIVCVPEHTKIAFEIVTVVIAGEHWLATL